MSPEGPWLTPSFQSFDSISVKADNVGDPRDVTDKYFVSAVKFDAGYVTLI